MISLSLILNIVVILYIWLDTDAVIEWSELLKLKFMKYEEYDASKKSIVRYATYSEFIEGKYSKDNFLCKLITCPICLSVWLNILALPFTTVSFLGANIVLTWVIYYCVKFIIKKVNE